MILRHFNFTHSFCYLEMIWREKLLFSHLRYLPPNDVSCILLLTTWLWLTSHEGMANSDRSTYFGPLQQQIVLALRSHRSLRLFTLENLNGVSSIEPRPWTSAMRGARTQAFTLP